MNADLYALSQESKMRADGPMMLSEADQDCRKRTDQVRMKIRNERDSDDDAARLATESGDDG